MKPNHLFTSMLAIATVVVTSCSAPRLAQQNANEDDVYNSVAQAKEYTPAPVNVQQPQNSNQYNEDDYYGASDPYYDMDYSSRINRFYYSSPWRTYYDPYFYDGWNMGIGMGFGSYYGNYWNSPYGGWGYLNSPFWSYNNWGWNMGWNNWGWNNYYGGGYYGGGFGGGFGGGGYYGGGYYTGRTTNVPNSARPARGSRDGYDGTGRMATGSSDAYLSPRSSAARSARENVSGTGSRTSSTGRPSRTSSGTSQNAPTRTEVARPSRESYTPPAPSSYNPPPTRSSSGSSSSGSSSSGSGSSSSGGGGSTGGGRPTRGGR
ncbi:hypothetical protein [Pedobacter frigoris]|uniref:Vitellogenin II n=1 Tax=Pedobacter frigoris TaxID=2571272 RepID=A0A4U1CLP3_9SPHI|nr:hypothetical protein [Pedobacter frigoris]TKC06110.1 hypothetical protein FA047_12345 [Pedobacter frigoris]